MCRKSPPSRKRLYIPLPPLSYTQSPSRLLPQPLTLSPSPARAPCSAAQRAHSRRRQPSCAIARGLLLSGRQPPCDLSMESCARELLFQSVLDFPTPPAMAAWTERSPVEWTGHRHPLRYRNPCVNCGGYHGIPYHSVSCGGTAGEASRTLGGLYWISGVRQPRRGHDFLQCKRRNILLRPV